MSDTNQKIESYQELCIRTAPDNNKITQITSQTHGDLIHACFGLITETGEATDVLKKHIFYNKPFDMVGFLEELGDIMWYIGFICEKLGISIEEVQKANIQKLMKRFPEKFNFFLSVNNRNLDAERANLESNLQKQNNNIKEL